MYCFAKLCRFCLTISDNLIDFKTKDCDNITYRQKVGILMPTLILSSQDFPELICENCRFQLNQSYNFITNCYEKHQLLLKYRIQINSLRVTNTNYNELQIKLETIDINKKRTSLLDLAVPSKLFKEYSEDEDNAVDNNTLIALNDPDEMIEEDHSNELLVIRNFQMDSKISIGTKYSNEENNKNEYLDSNEMINTLNPTPNNNDIINKSVVSVIEIFSEDSNDTASREIECKNDDKLKKCEICNYKFRNGSNLRKHMDVHNVINYSCSICNEKYNDYKSFDQHRKIHYTSKSAKLKTYIRPRSKNRYSIPKMKNLVAEKFQLQQPNDSIDAALQIKLRYGKKEKRHCCRICHKLFHRKQNLKRHYESVHLKIRYTCDICDKTFTETDALRRHKEIFHLNNKKFQCNICEQKLSSASKFRLHLKNRHNDSEDATNSKATLEVSCSEVSNESLPVIVKEEDAILTSEEIGNYLDSSLSMQNEKDNSHITTIENSQETNNTQLERDDKKQENLKDISNSCKICNKTFSSKPSLKRHNENIHLKIRYECNLCNKFFVCISSLSFHKKTVHLKIKKYKCHVCERKFSKSQQLSRHLHRHTMKRCNICERLFENTELLCEHYKEHVVSPEHIELLDENSSNHKTSEQNSDIEDIFKKEETNDVLHVEEIQIKSEAMLEDIVKEEYILSD